jgi:MOSC domain-containing protein
MFRNEQIAESCVTITLIGITVYPIKSARGIPAESWDLDEFGLQFDRRWMVVDQDGEFISQRDCPRLALVVPSVLDGVLRIEAPGMPALEVSLAPLPAVTTRVTIWDSTCAATWLGEAPARWFSDFLGCAASLVHMPAATMRPANPVYAPAGTRVSFVDGYPLLLISEESLTDLNRRLELPLPMNRFRPNLVVAGGEPYEEDTWTSIRIGEAAMQVVKPCDRCVITTTDQATAERGKEPLRTLATYRNVDGKVLFGQNLVHQQPGRLRVGERLNPDGFTSEPRRNS